MPCLATYPNCLFKPVKTAFINLRHSVLREANIKINMKFFHLEMSQIYIVLQTMCTYQNL
jgi:hypothetical protein